MLCVLFKTHMLLALPQKSLNFGIVAIINTSDIQIVDSDNGRGKLASKCIYCRLTRLRASVSHCPFFVENDVRVRPAAI